MFKFKPYVGGSCVCVIISADTYEDIISSPWFDKYDRSKIVRDENVIKYPFGTEPIMGVIGHIIETDDCTDSFN